MIFFFKKLIKNLLQLINIKIIKINSSIGIVNKNEWIPFDEKSKDLLTYFEGLEKSGNAWSDSLHKQCRFLDLMNLAKIILKKKNYDFAEVGCWKGHSSYLISKLIYKSKKNINFHIFDSFEGLSNPTFKDKNFKILPLKQIEKIKKQFSSNEEFVKNNVLKNYKFIKTYKGKVPSKFFLVKNLKFSFVHIDLDLYLPTLETLQFFFPRLQNGGIIVCDDYNSKMFDGSKKAWDEFFTKNKVKFNFAPTIGGSFIIK